MRPLGNVWVTARLCPWDTIFSGSQFLVLKMTHQPVRESLRVLPATQVVGLCVCHLSYYTQLRGHMRTVGTGGVY